MDRRTFGTAVAATAAVVTRADEADAKQQPVPAALVAAAPENAIVPLPFAPTSLPGLSARLLAPHHDDNDGATRTGDLGAFLRNVRWTEVGTRATRALGRR